MSDIIELGKRWGVPKEDLEQMSREMGCDGKIPMSIGSARMTSVAEDEVNAGQHRVPIEVLEAEFIFEQRAAQRGEKTVLQLAQDAAFEHIVATVESQQVSHPVRYHAIARRVREATNSR